MPRIKPFATLWSELGRYFRDPRLRQLFARYATYCGSSPFSAPATLMLIAHAESRGVWLVREGMHGLAAALARLAEAKGVTIRYEADVTELLSSGRRATGVRLASGEVVPASAVIWNGDSSALGNGIAGSAAAGAFARRSPRAGRSRR